MRFGPDVYAAVLLALGLLPSLGRVAELSNDAVGQAMAGEALPKRVRLKRVKPQS